MMSDPEREAQIRLTARHPNPTPATDRERIFARDVKFLLRLLDEARAEVARWRKAEHEAREAAWEEAAQIAERIGFDANRGVNPHAREIAKEIRSRSTDYKRRNSKIWRGRCLMTQ